MATLCPAIVSSTDSKIELSTYTRAVGTIVIISCKGFGRQVKDPTRVVCQANGRWSEDPVLECEMKLDEKERVYVAVAVVCSLLFLFGLCWISAAIFCCRNRRRGWGSRWFGDRWASWGWFGGGRRSEEKHFGNRYDSDNDYRGGPIERKDYRDSFRRNDKVRDVNDNGWLVSRKSGRHEEFGSWRNNKRSQRNSWKDDRSNFRQNIYFMGVDSRAWDRQRPPLYPGESWRYGEYAGGKSRHAGTDGDFRFRDSNNARLDGGSRRYLENGRGRYGRHDEWDNDGKLPHNDMESIYRLRRKYDRVFDHEHPRIPNHYLPRDPRSASRGAVGPGWSSNYPVLKLTDHETIYSMYGDPMMRRRRYSDTFLDRQGYRSERIEGGDGGGGGFYRSSGEGVGGYRRTRRFSDSHVEAIPFRRVEYVQEQSPKRIYDVEERHVKENGEAILSSPGYEIITLPSKYTMAENGPRLVQLDTDNLKIPTYRRSYAQSDRDPNTDYFLSRQDFRHDSRKSQKESDHILYHGFGKRTEIYRD